MKPCPCCSQKNFADCCEPFLIGKTIPQTPKQLMRSRYTAYSLADINYIQKTMCKKAAENYDPVSAKKWASTVKWLGLTITDAPLPKNNIGTVTFIARFLDNNQAQSIAEKSTFEKINGRWFYTNGTTPK